MKKVLVIQSNEVISGEIEAVLSKDEFEIFYSHNIKDGLEISIRYSPDLILFYLNNIESSLYVFSKIVEEEKTSSIPLIVISDKNSPDEHREVMDAGADDYLPLEFINTSLLKSIDKRLQKLEKIRIGINNKLNSFEEENGKPKREDHILVKIGNKLKLVKFDEIVCITAMKEYSRIITTDNCKIVVRKSLKAWISLLPSKSFLQIHRSTIININCIEKIVKTNDRVYTVHLKYISETFDFSYRFANIMRNTFPT